ncbi:MAG: hypothetical protein ACOX3J_04950 [Clostridia bacterium]|jgi:hypothetical protein|nr:hypothetical protein [Clostridia bacterium]
MKGHIRVVKMFIYCYLLGVFLSWASYPVLIHLTFAVPLAISQSIYSIITTLVLLSFIYINLYDLGEKDRSPDIGATYEGKGFVCASVGFVLVVLAEVIMILIADKYFIVQHPHLVINNVNNYVRIILYMPFYWLYQIFDPNVVPRVNYLTSIVPGLLVIPTAGFGYLRGYRGKKFLNKNFDDIKKKLVYKGD